MITIRLLSIYLVAALCLSNAPTFAAVPKDEAEFTEFAMRQAAKRMPSFKFVTTDRLTIVGTRADGESTGDVSLERVYRFCSDNPRDAERALAQYLDGLAASTEERAMPVSKEMLRLIVREQGYIEDTVRRMGPGARALIYRPIVEGLVAVAVIDRPRTLKFVGDKELQKLELQEDDLFRLAAANMEKLCAPLLQAAKIPPAQQLGVIEEENAPWRLFQPSEWSKVAESMGGLVVMAPTSDLVIYCDGSSAAALDALRTLGLEASRRAERPLSSSLFKWTNEGWKKL